MKRFLAFNRKICVAMSILVFVLMVITTVGVIARYVFNHPLIWTWLSNRIIFGVFILFAGVLAMSENKHIRIEIFYDHFPPWMKVISKIITLISFMIFTGVLVWQTIWMGLNSLRMHERSSGAFRIPIYPFKLLIPIVSILFLVVGIIIFLRKDET
ncbi:MAG: hypothetical protein DSY91_04325 [Deltaproteobacteria bacterium]|nr:MAG: hypothetical protein DSY91_04325 [Deltaproteobacteria bacterium]